MAFDAAHIQAKSLRDVSVAEILDALPTVTEGRAVAVFNALGYIGAAAEYQDVWDWSFRRNSPVPASIVWADLQALRAVAQ